MNSIKQFFVDIYESCVAIVKGEQFDVRLKLANKSNNVLPAYATKDSSGFDLAYSGENKTLQPMERGIFGTGLFSEIPEGYEMQIRPRSGLAAKHGITVLNAPGTIDPDYRGEIGVILINLGSEPYTIMNRERIAQGVICKQERAKIKGVPYEELSDTCRGKGGYGHTGKQ